MRFFPSHISGVFLTSGLLLLAPPAQAEAPRLQEFPSASQLWLCYVKGQLGAAKQKAILSDGAGTLRILREHGGAVEKDEVFAISRPEKLELQRESLLLEKILLASKIKETRLDEEEAFLALEVKKAEAQAELFELEAVADEEEVRQDTKLKERLEEAIKTTREKIVRLDARLALQQKNTVEETQIQKLNLEYRQSDQEFESARLSAERRSPFVGFFTFSEELAAEHGDKEAPFEIWVENTELIGHVIDNSSYEVILADFPPILNQMPLEKLVLQFDVASEEEPISARFLETRSLSISGIGGRGKQILVFRISKADRKRVAPLTGSTPLGQVYLELPEGCHLVPKADLMKLVDEGEHPAGGWSVIASSIWPDVELFAVGHLDLALRKKEKPDPDSSSDSKPAPQR
jgi:hypothetical protein